MKQYLDLGKHILENGKQRDDRTGTGTIGVFGYQMRFDLKEGFPATTTKELFVKGVIHELLWFLEGNTNIKYLVDNGVNIWNKDAHRWYKQKGGLLDYKNFIKQIKESDKFAQMHGDLGRVYGAQWRSWMVMEDGGASVIDQIQAVIESIKEDPYSRRHIVSAWKADELHEVALPPCHVLFQFYVQDGELSCQLYQRSSDFFLGAPFNIASYALLTHMIAKVCDLEVGEFVHTFGDVHIYNNHIEQVKEQLSREPKALPTLEIKRDVKDIFDFKYEDFELKGYEPHPAIKGEVSVG